MPADWFSAACADAERRGLPQVVSVLDGLRTAVERLRAVDWYEAAADPEWGRTSASPMWGSASAAPRGGRASALPASVLPSATPPDRAAATTSRLLDGLTIVDAGARLRDGTLTATSLAEAALGTIAARDPQLNAFIAVLPESARAEAARADEELRRGHDRGPLHGIPISIKDLVDIAGLPTTAASRVRAGHLADADAPVVARLRDAGAVIVGKTNLHEFALGTTNEDSAYGPVLHPMDPTRSPGGSSGGSAVSVVTGMCLGTVGSDTGGSIRIPSAVCGLVGLKPAHDEVPAAGVVPLSRRLDHVGPLARSVADARLLFEVLSGRPITASPERRPASAIRAALVGGFATAVLQDEVRAALEQAVGRLVGAGVSLAPVTLPRLADAAAIYLPLVLAEAAALHARTLDACPELYTPPVRTRLEMGRYVTGEDYVRALAGVDRLRADVDALLETHDVLVLPTMPIVAPPLGVPTVRVGDADLPVRALMLRLTQPFNLTRHPAITLPMPVGNGLPVGLQLVGRRTADLLAVAESVERLLQ